MKISHSWIEIIYSVPEVVFAFIEVFSLTFSPAAIQDTVSEKILLFAMNFKLTKIEPLIYENRNIWLSNNPRLHEIAQLYVHMSKQSNLGVTIWGFALVNKPLILTVSNLLF